MKEKVQAPQLRFPGFTDDWEERKLGDEVTFFSGLTYSPDNIVESGSTLVLRSSNVKNGEIVDADNVYVENEAVNSDNVQVGDVIVVVRNGSRNLIGKHAQIKKEMDDTVIGAFMTGVRSDTPYFINALLDTEQFTREIYKNLGATINQITTGAFKKMQFVVPKNKTEKEQIGNFFKQIDDTIALHQRKLDLLKEQKKGYLQKMFPKNGAKVPELRFAGFADDWEERKLGEVATFLNGRAYKQDELLDSGKYKVLRVGNFYTNDSWYYSNMELGDKYYVDKGDLVYTWSATFGPHIWSGEKVIYHYHIWKVELSKFLDRNFTLQLLEADKARLLSSTNGSTMIHVTKGDMESKIVSIPNIDEQKQIGSFFKQLDNTITLHQRKLDLLKEQKKGFLQKMFI
ncbi:restriction endonuclease subunit S [Lactococcus lactis]|uniref:restriction endonuclease subunit S n=1 Tax=Lactococcus lactis TaxID=1358 RepID=UPI0038CFA4B3